MYLTKVVVKTPDELKVYENVRAVEQGTNRDLMGNLIDALRTEFEILCSDGKRVTIDFNSIVEIVL